MSFSTSDSQRIARERVETPFCYAFAWHLLHSLARERVEHSVLHNQQKSRDLGDGPGYCRSWLG